MTSLHCRRNHAVPGRLSRRLEPSAVDPAKLRLGPEATYPLPHGGAGTGAHRPGEPRYLEGFLVTLDRRGPRGSSRRPGYRLP